MRFNVAALPALTAGLLLVIATALGSEPPISNPENGIVANVLHEPEPVMHTYTLPRVAANLEGDIAPVLFVTGRTFDFPAWSARPEPTATVAAATRVPLPQIASVPQHCPALIVDTFGVNAPAACRVARCESSWRADAVGAAGEVGWFQVHPIHFPHLYATYGADADLSSPTINTAYAYSLSRGGSDWTHWSCKP